MPSAALRGGILMQPGFSTLLAFLELSVSSRSLFREACTAGGVCFQSCRVTGNNPSVEWGSSNGSMTSPTGM